MADYTLNKPYPQSWNGVSKTKQPDKSKPLPPRNIFCTHPYEKGVLDIRWDNPLKIPENSQWNILGVNIYRSTDSEAGPFTKINSTLIQTSFYRDKTTHTFISNEDCLPTLTRGSDSVCDWVFTTSRKPIVKESSQNETADTSKDVYIRIDNSDGQGALIVPAYKVNGITGEIFLITNPIYNSNTKLNEDPRLPDGPDAKLYCSYWYNNNFVKSDLYPRYFYKITTIGRDVANNILETSLDDVKAQHVFEIDKPDYLWQGVIVKNRFLLEQFGERAKLFIRKEVGETCPFYVEDHAQSHNDCLLCYGTNILGGFLGPIDIIMAPPEAEKKIDITPIGLRLNYSFESWTGPSPLIRTGDFIVRQNGERMIIGAVTPQGAKGAVFQQHFTLNYRDVGDILYKVPIHGGETHVPISQDTRGVNQPITDASPVIPEYKSDRAETDKGRNINYENITW